MNKLTKTGIIATILLLFLQVSCIRDYFENDKEAEDDVFTNEDVSDWIYYWMNTIYLWNDQIPTNLDLANLSNPIQFYDYLLYEEEDKWSYITDDFNEFEAELNGTPTSMGYSPSFGKFRNSDRIFMVVEYVIPDTPADKAGLKRGDIILTLNGEEMNIDNYYTLYQQNSYTAELGVLENNTLNTTGESISLEAEIITSKPVIHSEIITYQDLKIGYLVYVEFTSGPDNSFVYQLDAALSDFKNEEIDELIIDFRYNPGGEIGMAAYLASAIAPSATVDPSKILVSYVYNDILTEMFIDNGGENSRDLNRFFTTPNVSLNMNRIYCMTGPGTASASELVITGLDPYMDVIQVGDTTIGKYTGAWVFPDTETPPRHNYAIVPIVLKYANSLGFTEFKNGLYPDYPVYDQLIGADTFGSINNDVVLAKTLEVMTGVNPATSKSMPAFIPEYEILPDQRKIERKNIQKINKDIYEKFKIYK